MVGQKNGDFHHVELTIFTIDEWVFQYIKSSVWENDFALVKKLFKIVLKRHKITSAVECTNQSITTVYLLTISLHRQTNLFGFDIPERFFSVQGSSYLLWRSVSFAIKDIFNGLDIRTASGECDLIWRLKISSSSTSLYSRIHFMVLCFVRRYYSVCFRAVFTAKLFRSHLRLMHMLWTIEKNAL